MPKIDWDERDEIARRNRSLLDGELRAKRLVFQSRPYEAHVQFTNFCNMSCIMCWDGNHPPLKKMSPELRERFATQIAADLSVITPYDGSEPTALDWDEIVRIAGDYSVQLALTSNMQLFDEQKFEQVKDRVEMIVMSIDSHVPEILEKIRPGATAETVYANAETTARLCREHGIECIVQAVFMTDNAPMLPETVARMADLGVSSINVIQMIDVNRHSWHLDPTMHFSAEFIDWIKTRCVATARQKRIRLGWDLTTPEWFDFRDPDRRIPVRDSKDRNDAQDGLLKLRHPGFCKYAYHRLRITADGDLSPCGFDTDGELHLGNLLEQDFEQIWNGPAAQDLRRAHYTWDYPSLCASCRFVDRTPPKTALPFLDDFLRRYERDAADVEPVLLLAGPEHMSRVTEPPPFRFRKPDREIARYLLVLAPGGESKGSAATVIEPSEGPDGTLELVIPDRLWKQLSTNVGYWWIVAGIDEEGGAPVVRSQEIRCLIRHAQMPRIQGSTLPYGDQEQFAFLYLGGERQLGFGERGQLPGRPPLRHRGGPDGPGLRFARRRVATGPPSADVAMSRDAYGELVGQIRDVVRSALPPQAAVLVVSKGDERLLDLNGCSGRHFPSDADGNYLGYHPPDDDWAIGEIERMRAEGAAFLLFPASALWWLDHYRGLRAHLERHYAGIVEDRDRCLIFDLRAPQA